MRPARLQPAYGIIFGLRIALCIWLGVGALAYGLSAALMAGRDESARILLAGQEHFRAAPRTASAEQAR